MIIGPMINSSKPGSLDHVFLVFDKQVPFLADYSYGYVDVRDVAKCHVNALAAPNANGKRYIVSNQHLWARDIALILKSKYPDISATVAPHFVWKLIGLFDPVIRTWIVPRMGILSTLCDNAETVKDLDVQFRRIDESVLDTADSLLKHGFVKRDKTKKSAVKTAMQVVVFGATAGALVYSIKKYILRK